MKKNILIILLLFSISAIAQNREVREIGSFDKIDVFGNVSVEMKKGNKESVEITALSVELADVKTNVEDKLLKISMSSDLFKEDSKVKVVVTFKELSEIYCNASAEIDINDELTGDKLIVEATSGGIVTLKVKFNAVDLKAYQGAQIDISGETKLQESIINTGGVLSGTNFKSNEVLIKVNTGGKAEIVVNEKLNARVNTKGSLSYFGTPKEEDIKTSLGGTISAWDKK